MPPPPPTGPPPPPIDVSGLDPAAANAAHAMAAPPFWHIEGPHLAQWVNPLSHKLTARCFGDGQKFAQAGHDTGFFIPHLPLYPNTLLPIIVAFSACRWLIGDSHVEIAGAPAAFGNTLFAPYLTCGDPMPRPGFGVVPVQRTVQLQISILECLRGLELVFITMTFDFVVQGIFGPASAYFGQARKQIYEGVGRNAGWQLYSQAVGAKMRDDFAKSLTYGILLDGKLSAPFSLASMDYADGKLNILVWSHDSGRSEPDKQQRRKLFIKRRITTVELSDADAAAAVDPNVDALAEGLPELQASEGSP